MNTVQELVKMEHISKSYTGVQALRGVNFTLKKGEIHALCGENGAGKSTLIKILTGAETYDSGKIYLEGNSIRPKTPLDARNLGIGTVYQEVNLCGNLSVAENIYIGRQPMTKAGMIDWRKMNRMAEVCMARLNIKIDVTARLDEYSVAIQQMVAIASALDLDAKVFVLDEPTSSLDTNEVANLFRVMRELKAKGIGIVFISHFFDQIFEISDTITVLRNGEFIDKMETAQTTRVTLVEKMLGKSIMDLEYSREKSSEIQQGVAYYHSEGLGKKGTIGSLPEVEIKAGSVTSFAGLLGSGRTETARLIFGVDKPDSGKVCINGTPVTIHSPHDAVRNGMGFCPENRKTEGIIVDMSIRENIVLALQGKRGMWKPIGKKEQYEIADKYIEMLKIKAPSADVLVGNLSGGNQQKVLIAKWLATDPSMLLLDEPTRGIDVGAKSEIQKLMIDLAAEGKAILFISSEISEVTRCADSVYIYRDKVLVNRLSMDEITENNIFSAIADAYHGADRLYEET